MVARRSRIDETPADSSTMARASRPVHYPESDGKSLGETETHVREMLRLLQTLDFAFASRIDVYVGADLFVYYEEGNPRAVVAPDVMVAIGASKLPWRRTFKTWEEQALPTFIIEVTSPSTRRDDLVRKRDIYARIGVLEYVLYDPLGEYLHPSLQGFTLQGGVYRPMAMLRDALISDRLDIELSLTAGRLQLVDRGTGQRLLDSSERAAAGAEVTAELARQLMAERAANRELERQIARLKESVANPQTQPDS